MIVCCFASLPQPPSLLLKRCRISFFVRFVFIDTWNHIERMRSLSFWSIEIGHAKFESALPFCHSIWVCIEGGWSRNRSRRRRLLDGVKNRSCKLMMKCDLSPGNSLVALSNWTGSCLPSARPTSCPGYHHHYHCVLFCVLSRRRHLSSTQIITAALPRTAHLIQNNKFDFDANNKVISNISPSSVPQ